MNKEVGYIMQGFLLMLLLVGGIAFIRFLASLPVHAAPQTVTVNTTSSNTPAILINQKGKELFQNNCASCHSVIKEIQGPSLENVEQRVPDKKLLYAWIRNNSAVLKSGNKYFNDLVVKFGNVRMTPFLNLSDDDITAILEYIRQASALKKLPVADAAYQ